MKTIHFSKRLFATLLALSCYWAAFSQTGPAGVGNSNGSSGQPRNVMWLDASYLDLSNSDFVSEWTDRSGNDWHATQSEALRQPVFTTNLLNGYPALYFDNDAGTGSEQDFLSYDGSAIVNTDLTVFFVAARRSNGRNMVLGGTTTASNKNLHFGWTNSTRAICNHWGNDIVRDLISGSAGSGYIGDADGTDDYGIFVNRLASTEATLQRKLYQNGTKIGELSNANKLTSYDGAAIGRWSDGTIRYYDINVAEVIQFSTALTGTQRILVENYLAAKYSIALDTGGDAVLAYSGYGNFYRDVAGIGRLSATDAHTTASSAGFYMLEDGGASLNNNAFLMYGHDNTTNSTADESANVTAAGAQAAWPRAWLLKKTNVSSGIVQVVFDFKEGFENGEYPQNVSNYVLLEKSSSTGTYSQVAVVSTALADADQVAFEIAATDLIDGNYYTIGTTDKISSPIEGEAAQKWYALKSGDWDDWESWTLDPSGNLPNNPNHETPSSAGNTADKVYITTGKTITIQPTNNNKINSEITVDGRLDLTTTTGHDFGFIRGSGRILMPLDNFPNGDASHFYTKGQGEGTAVYYGTGLTMSTNRTFFNVEVELDNPTDVFTLTNNLSVHGKLTIEKGVVQINDNTDSRILELTVDGDVSVGANGQITVGSGNTNATTAYAIGGSMPAVNEYHAIFHKVKFGGNLTNNGSMRFTNETDPIYNAFSTKGAASVWFTGANNAEVNLNGTSDFYNLIVDKGTDKTYTLTVNSANVANFELYGPNNVGRTGDADDPEVRKALWVRRGTLKLTGSISIPTLSEGGTSGGNGDYAIGKSAAFWIASSGVTVYSTASEAAQVKANSAATITTSASNQAMSVYGLFRISAGTFGTRNSAGFIFWSSADGQVRIEGGNVNVSQFRSAGSGGGKASYFQSGGTLTVRGNETEAGEYDGNLPIFGFDDPSSVFTMSGGEIIIRDEDGDDDPDLYIPSADGNYNVTGGTITIDIANGRSFQFSSTATLWNVELKNNNNTGEMSVFLLNDLKVGNDLTLNPYITLDVESPADASIKDVYIGGKLSLLEDGTTENVPDYKFKTNTTYFNGTQDGEVFVEWNHDDSYEDRMYNVVINKPKGKKVLLTSSSQKYAENVSSAHYARVVHVENEFTVVSGTFDQGKQSIRLHGAISILKDGQCGVYEHGVTHLDALIMLKDESITINSEKGATMGNVKLNPNPETEIITLTSDLYVKRISYYHGRINMGRYQLKLDYLHKKNTTNLYPIANGNAASEMFFSDGNASDGGLSLYVEAGAADNTMLHFPLGVAGKYTYATVSISGVVDDGYINIRPVDAEIPLTPKTGGEILTYYWRVKSYDFTTTPNVAYTFNYNDADVGSKENTYKAGQVLDIDPYTATTTYGSIDKNNNILSYSSHPLNQYSYSAGEQSRFSVTIDKFYSPTARGNYNWNDKNTWYKENGNKYNKIPTEGSIVVVRGEARVNVHAGIEDIAALEFDHDYVTNPAPNSENVPRLQFYAGGTFTFGTIKGTGMLSFNAPNAPNLVADLGEFGNNTDSYFLYYGGSSTLNNIPTPIPNLMCESATYTIDQQIEVQGDLIVQGNGTIIPKQSIDVNENLLLGYWSGGTFRFSGTGSAVDVTVKGNVDFTQPSSVGNRHITVDNSGSLEHRLIVHGDIIHGDNNSNNFDLYTGASNVVLELQGTGTHSYTRNSTGTFDLYRLEVNKGADQTNSFTFNNGFTLQGATNGVGVKKALELKNGTLILNHASLDFNLTTGDDKFIIPAEAALEVQEGTVRMSGDDTGIFLDGKLAIKGGFAQFNGAGNGNNFIEYSASSNATIELTAGELNLGSQLRRQMNTEDGILSYTQTGGSATFGMNAAPVNDRGVFEILNTGSKFEHNGGTLVVARQQTNPEIAALYLNPDQITLGNGSQITIGGATTPTGQNVGMYIVPAIKNIQIDNTSSNSPTASLWSVPLTVEQSITIDNGTTFNSSGLQINIAGHFINNGTYTHSNNLVVFDGTETQEIQGSSTTSFYQITKNTANTLGLQNDIFIDDDLRVELGTFADNSHEIVLRGDIYNSGVLTNGGSGDGLIFQGAVEQVVNGTGQYGKITIDNINKVKVGGEGYNIVVNNAVQLKQGVFDIGGKFLIMEQQAVFVPLQPYSIYNMVNTNRSFTDNGIKKKFAAGAGSFFIPIGSGGKYTPIQITISQNTAPNGEVIVKAADEYHPTINDDSESPDCELVDTENVLQFYWTVTTQNIVDGTGALEFFYDEGDVRVNNSCGYDIDDYIPAKVLNDNSGNWFKYDWADFDKNNKKVIFTFDNVTDAEITGDYTAGIQPSPVTINGAIPNQVPIYETIASGNWSDPSIWSPTIAGGPRGAIVKINVGHAVTIDHNYISAFTTEILGEVLQGTTFGNRLGNVSGNGLLQTSSEIIPAGYYVDFFAASGGKLEYTGNNDIDILNNLGFVNDLILSGTGERRFPNIDVTVRGDLNISGTNSTLEVINEHNKRTILKGDLTFTQGVFDAGTGENAVVEFSGTTPQVLSGNFTGTSAFYNFEIGNTTGLTLNSTVEIDNELTLTKGVIISSSANLLKLNSTSEDVVNTTSNLSYVDGPLQKNISSGGGFVFPVGDGGRIGRITLSGVNNGSSAYWETEYKFEDPESNNLYTANFDSPVQKIDSEEYWRVKAPSAGLTSQVAVGWTNNSAFSPTFYQNTDLRIVEWKDNSLAAANRKWNIVGQTITGTPSLGAIGTSTAPTFNEYTTEYTPSGNFFTIGVTDLRFEWEGITDTDWNVASNWNKNQVPTTTDNIVIPVGKAQYPLLNTATVATANNITIESGASVTVPTGKILDVKGTLLNNGTLLLKNEAQLLDAGTVEGSGAFQLERTVSGGYGYHYLSSPVEGATDATLANKFVHSSGASYIFKYIEANADNNVNNNAAWAWFTGELTPGIGYPTVYRFPATETFSGGKFNTGDISTSITYQSASTIFKGFNLVGNPYPSNVDAELFINANSKIEGTIMFWDDDETLGENFKSDDYAYWNATGGVSSAEGSKTPNQYIPPAQGFFVRHKVGEGTSNFVNFTNAMRTSNQGVFFKKSAEQEITQRLKLELKGTNSAEYSQTLVGFRNDATEEHDRLYDGVKIPVSLSKAPAQLYSILDNTPYAIQGLPLRWDGAPKDLRIPLGISIENSGTFTIKRIQFEEFSKGYDIFLIDKETNTTVNLREETMYSFTASAGVTDDRFELHFDQQGIDWTGAVSTDWNTAGNWSTNTVPSVTDNVVIKATANQPIISSHVSLRGLYIESNAKLSVQPQASLTMNGDWINDGSCIFHSDATGYGTLIDNGSITGSGTFEIEKFVKANQWNLVGAATEGQFTAPSTAQARIFAETTNSWSSAALGTLSALPAFALQTQQDEVLRFTGIPNTGAISKQLTASSAGWNMIANNYPSYLDWDDASWSKTSTSSVVYVWNGTQYGAYIAGMNGVGTNQADNKIAPMQAVFVQATEQVEMSFENSLRKTHFAEKKNASENNMLRLRVAKDNIADELLLVFGTEAYQANKLFSDAEGVHGLYTETDNKQLAINSYAAITDATTIPISLKAIEDGTYTLNVDFLDAFTLSDYVILKDLKTGEVIDLREADEVTFDALSNDTPQRFELVFRKSALGVLPTAAIGFDIYANAQIIFVRQDGDLQDAELSVFNTLGEKVVAHYIQQKDITRVDMSNFAKGIYVVKVKSDKGITSKQVFVQ